MDLLEGNGEEPKSKLRRYLITALALALLLAWGAWYLLRFHTEKKTVETFLQALVRGDTAQAYRIWNAPASYPYKDFLEDWATARYYGPVRSYRIVTAQQKPGASGVVVVVELSPDTPFPQEHETEKLRRIKEVRIWVERKDQSLSFPP